MAATLVETAILGAADANARRDIEKPIACAMANQYNAQAFKAFMEATGITFNATGIDDAIKAYVDFVQSTGKS